MKKTETIILLAAAALIGASCSHKAENGSATGSAEKVDVAYPVVDSVMLHNTYPGYLIANREVELVARVDGYLLSHPYKSGDFVRKGTVLFQIEDRNYRDAVVQAQAALETARANREYAASRYAAMKRALESDAVSEMEVAQAKSTLEEAEASVKNARASLQTAETSLSYCTVRAPFDGHVTTVFHDDGSYLSGAGAPVSLAKIFDDAVMVVKFSVEDTGYLDMLQSQKEKGLDLSKIPVSFSEKLPHEYTCDLSYLAPQIDTSTGTMTVQATINNPYGELKSGMYAKVDLPYRFEPAAVMVLDAAIGTDQLGDYLYTVNDSNRVVSTPVKTGQTVADTLRIINSGITPDTRYVTKALLKVRDGMTVDPVAVK